MSTDPFWGKIEVGNAPPTPFTILNQAGVQLQTLTDKLLTARTTQEPHLDGFGLRMYIHAPLLNGYSYEVLRAKHDIGLYPVQVMDVAEQSWTTCDNVDEFRRQLAKILQSDRVKRVISSLIAQSRQSSSVS